MQPLPERALRSPALQWLLEEDRPRRGRGGRRWAVVIRGDVLADGVLARVMDRVRTERYPVGDRPPARLVQLAAAAGVQVVGDATVTRDGAILVPSRHASGPAMLRMAAGDAGVALRHAAVALQLMGGEVDAVPRLLSQVELGPVSASVEQRMSGRRPHHLRGALIPEVARTLDRAGAVVAAVHPSRATAADAVNRCAAAITRACPEAPGLGALSSLAERAADQLAVAPAGLEHGDLWHHNLLAHRGHLTGVVDWDSWDPDGVVGADLLGVVATWDRLHTKRSIGQAVADRIWSSRSELLIRLGVPAGQIDALGIAWWLRSVDGTLRRLPERAEDAAWLHSAMGLAGGATSWMHARPGLS